MTTAYLRKRALAGGVDASLLMMVFAPAAFGAYLSNPFPFIRYAFFLCPLPIAPWALSAKGAGLPFATLCLLANVILAAFESSTRQGTPGKMLFGLRCVTAKGQARVSFWRAFARSCSRVLSVPLPVAPLIFLVLYSTRTSVTHPIVLGLLLAPCFVPSLYLIGCFGSGRCLHDFVSGTRIIDVESEPPPLPPQNGS